MLYKKTEALLTSGTALHPQKTEVIYHFAEQVCRVFDSVEKRSHQDAALLE